MSPALASGFFTTGPPGKPLPITSFTHLAVSHQGSTINPHTEQNTPRTSILGAYFSSPSRGANCQGPKDPACSSVPPVTLAHQKENKSIHCREPARDIPLVTKVMRKEAPHTQTQDRASGVPPDILKHLPPKNQSLPTLLLCALTSDFTGGCPPPPSHSLSKR